jgi:uncharacterized membrane protein
MTGCALKCELEFRMTLDFAHAAVKWLGLQPHELAQSERKALEHAIERRTIAEDPDKRRNEKLTFGDRVSDRVAQLGGSWTFISIFCLFLVAWVAANLLLSRAAFDPYPFIFLNLILSMLAALQAPVIMMSQNRQASIDRQMAVHDYEVNLKAEIEIMALHEKMDALRTEQLAALLHKQQEQIDLLTNLLAQTGIGGQERGYPA